MAGKSLVGLDANSLYTEVHSKTSATDASGVPVAGDIPALGTGGVLDYTLLPGVSQSAGNGSANKVPLLDATGKLDLTLFPATVGPETNVFAASEALNAGDYVNIWNSSNTAKARKADASTTGKPANGFVLAAVAAGANATVYFDSTNTQVTGMAAGSPVYLDPANPGKGTTTPPTYTAGQTTQILGVAGSASSVAFQPRDPVART